MKNVLHGQLEVLCFAGHCNISSLNLELGSRPGIEFVSGKGFDLAKSAYHMVELQYLFVLVDVSLDGFGQTPSQLFRRKHMYVCMSGDMY